MQEVCIFLILLYSECCEGENSGITEPYNLAIWENLSDQATAQKPGYDS